MEAMERKIKVTYYGMLEEAVGLREEAVSVTNDAIDLRDVLTQRHPALQDFTFSIAVDMEYRDQLTADESPSKIDVMPPFSGG